MVLVIDDLLYTLTLQPFEELLRTLRDTALKEKYDVKKIQDQIKELRMLYEFDEVPEEEYEEKMSRLNERLKTARRVQKNISNNVKVLKK